DHVVVIVLREMHPHSVRRLGRSAMADVVGKDDVVAADVERLATAVKLISELRLKELLACPACAVEHHHSIVDLPGGIAMRVAKRGQVNSDLWQGLAVAEPKVGEGDVLFVGGPRLCSGRCRTAAPPHRLRDLERGGKNREDRHPVNFSSSASSSGSWLGSIN